MRVLHIVSEPGSHDRGVPQKVAATVESWRRLGVDADFVDLATASLGSDGVGDRGPERRPRLGRAGWVLEMERRARRLREVLDRQRPDVVYSRELVWSPAVESIFRRHPVVLEINSDRATELASSSRAAAAFWRTTSARNRRRARGIVSVTNELARKLVPESVPWVTIPNGEDVADRPPPRLHADRPLLVMLVGGVNAWQGMDRVDALARALPQFDFGICGDLGSAAQGLSERVRRIPPMKGRELDDLLSRTTVCLGTLALSRKSMTEACPLKSRTALASGVPLIYAYDDPQLDGDEIFALRVADAPTWSREDLERIESFVERAAGDPSIGVAAWDFARRNIDRDVLEQRRIDFMAGLLREPGS